MNSNFPTESDWLLAWSFAFSVFPLIPNSKRPLVEWTPYQTHRVEVAQALAWIGNNIGIATGAISGIFVMDLDSEAAIATAKARGLPDTFLVETPRGRHVYFQHPGGIVRNATGIMPGIDIRGDGGYVVGPGSYYSPTEAERASGKVEGRYTGGANFTIAPAPDWILDLLLHRDKPSRPMASHSNAETTSGYGRAALAKECQSVRDAMEGSRNDTFNRAAFAVAGLVAGGEIVATEAANALREAASDSGLDFTEIEATLASGWGKGYASPRTSQSRNGGPISGIMTRPRIVNVGDGPGYFAGCVYVTSRDAIFVPNGMTLKRSPFDAKFGGPTFVLNSDGSKSTKSAWDAFLMNDSWVAQRADATCFRPELPSAVVFTVEGLAYLNCYVPIDVERTAGDARPFVSHVRKMLPEGNDADLLLHYMASAVQNPGAKFQWWPFVQGVKGNGKTMLLMCMVAAIGSRYCHLVNSKAMINTANQFNAWIENKLFLGFEEVYTTEKREMSEALKATVTNRRIAMEGKGRDQTTIDNRANGLLLSNHRDAVTIEDDERRFGVFYCAQQDASDLVRDGMGGMYFPALYNWLDNGGFAIVAHYLATMQLQAELDPARNMHRAPRTSSTIEAVEASHGVWEQEVLEVIGEGRQGFCGGLVSSHAVTRLFQERRINISPRKMREVMKAIGYDWHPGLVEGRVNDLIPGEGKPRIYVKTGHPVAALRSPPEIAKAYRDAQLAALAKPSNDNLPGR